MRTLVRGRIHISDLSAIRARRLTLFVVTLGKVAAQPSRKTKWPQKAKKAQEEFFLCFLSLSWPFLLLCRSLGKRLCNFAVTSVAVPVNSAVKDRKRIKFI